MAPPRHILESDKQVLKDRLDEMHRLVCLALDKAMQSLVHLDADIANQVVAEDSAVNKLRHEVEDACISTIALQQPVASDLRMLMTDIFVSMELERIADHAVAIAEIVLQFGHTPDQRFINPVVEIAEKCKLMLKDIMQAYDETDEHLARNTAAKDDEIDRAEREFNALMLREMCSQPDHSSICTYLLWITHNLERIGDRITNVAERVVYMATNVTPDLNG